MAGRTRHHVTLVIGIVVGLFGLLSLASVGLWFLLVGCALLSSLALKDPKAQAALIAGALGFTVTVVLISPFVCTTTEIDIGGKVEGGTRCSNALGIDYAGGVDYDAPMWPALLAGVVVGSVSAAVAALVAGTALAGEDRDQRRRDRS